MSDNQSGHCSNSYQSGIAFQSFSTAEDYAKAGPQLLVKQSHDEAVLASSRLQSCEADKINCYRHIAEREGVELRVQPDSGDLSFRMTVSEETFVSLLEARIRLIEKDAPSLDTSMFTVLREWLSQPTFEGEFFGADELQRFIDEEERSHTPVAAFEASTGSDGRLLN